MTNIPRLCEATLKLCPVAAPPYDRGRVSCGIVHFGPGAFQRAHIASYIDALLPRDPRWGIAGIALRHGALAADLKAQDFLYALVELDTPPRYRILGALRDFIVAPADPARALARLLDPAARLVTITVTEKGYCLDAAGGLDSGHPDIAHDLANPNAPRSLIGWLALAATRRLAQGLEPLVVMSCDNVASNGAKLRRAVLDFAQATGGAARARAIGDATRFPSTMVDSITPHADAAFLAGVAAAIGLEDRAAVQRETFTQWVVEDDLGPCMPDLASVGVQLTSDVHAYEQAKLRLLNGAHSVLAYLGLLRGHETVADTMTDPALAGFVERLMRTDVAPTLKQAKGLDVSSYIDGVLARLRSPVVAHRLAQIAADGSLKLPYRFLEPIADLQTLGRPVARLCVPIAAWMRFVVERRGETLDDPLADLLARTAGGCTGAAATDVPRFLALREIFPDKIAADAQVRAAIETAYADLTAALA